MGSMTAHLNISTYSISTSIKCMLSVADFLSYTKAFEFFLLAKHVALIGCLVYTYLFSFSVCTIDKYIRFQKKCFNLSSYQTMKLSTGIHNKIHVQFIRKSAAVTNVGICIPTSRQ